MSETSVSLLQRLQGTSDEESWQRLEAIYSPLIRGWLHRDAKLDVNDADDVVQDVMLVVIRRINGFNRQRTGSFRTWLKSITVNCLRKFYKKRRQATSGGSDLAELLNQLEDPGSLFSGIWDREHDEHVMKQILNALRTEFTENTWRAFTLTALEGRSPDDAAGLLGISVNAVFVARSRVMSRLKQEAAGLID